MLAVYSSKMVLPDLTSEQTIRDLAFNRLRWPTAPWNSRRRTIAFYRRLCADMCRGLNLKSRIEWNHYGSGYASYIDAWFYRNTSEFRVIPSLGYKHEYKGLWVLLHRQTPFYVVGQGEQHWGEARGASYLPSMDAVDDLAPNAMLTLSNEIDRELSEQGLIRLHRDDLVRPIPQDVIVETNLSSGSLHLFDALFHWMD